MWKACSGRNWQDIKCPALSRWEHVCEAVQHMVKYKAQWLSVTQYIIDMNNVDTNKNDIESYLYSYLNKDILYA